MFFFTNLQKRGLSIIFSAGIFYVSFVLYSDFNKFENSFQNIHLIYLPIILCLVIFSAFLKSERQRFFLKLISINISIKDSLVIFIAGQSLLVTPLGFGAFIKSHFLKRNWGHLFSKTIPIIFVERYFDMVGILSIISIFLILQSMYEFLIPIVALDVLFGLMFITVRNKGIFLKIVKFVSKIPIVNKATNILLESYDSVMLLTSRKSLIIGWPFSTLCWMIDALVAYVCFLSFNVQFNFLKTTLISFIAFVLGTISFLPGGLGITEVSMTGFLLQSGISLSTASALVFYNRLVSIWFSTFLGFIFTKIAIGKRN